MATYGLTLVTAPMESPVSLEEAKKQVEVGADSSVHDQHLERLIEAARVYVEAHTGRQLVNATYDCFIDRLPLGNGPVKLPKSPLVSVTSVKYLDSNGDLTTWTGSNYSVSQGREPGQISPAYGVIWPSIRATADSVQIRFVAGYGAAKDVPAPLKQAILLLVGDWFERREDAVQGNPGHIPTGVANLLEMYRVGDEFTVYVRDQSEYGGETCR